MLKQLMCEEPATCMELNKGLSAMTVSLIVFMS